MKIDENTEEEKNCTLIRGENTELFKIEVSSKAKVDEEDNKNG